MRGRVWTCEELLCTALRIGPSGCGAATWSRHRFPRQSVRVHQLARVKAVCTVQQPRAASKPARPPVLSCACGRLTEGVPTSCCVNPSDPCHTALLSRAMASPCQKDSRAMTLFRGCDLSLKGHSQHLGKDPANHVHLLAGCLTESSCIVCD